MGYLDTVERNARVLPLQLAFRIVAELSHLRFQLCDTCSQRAWFDLARLGQTLELEIQSAIAKVGFQLMSMYNSTPANQALGT